VTQNGLRILYLPFDFRPSHFTTKGSTLAIGTGTLTGVLVGSVAGILADRMVGPPRAAQYKRRLSIITILRLGHRPYALAASGLSPRALPAPLCAASYSLY
jgi:hypothetical protein